MVGWSCWVSIAAAQAEDPRLDALAWSPDGALYGARGYLGVVRLDPATGEPRETLIPTPELGVDRLLVDATGFVILGGATVATFDPRGRAQLAIPLPEDDGFPTAVALSPDGKTLAVSSCACARPPVTLFDRATGRKTAALDGLRDEREHCAGDVAFVGSSVVAVGADGRTAIWRGGRLEHEHLGVGAAAEAVAASPDGRALAVAGWSDAGNVLDPATGRAAWSFGFVGDTVRGLDWSADGRWLAAWWPQGGAVWDTRTHAAVGALPGVSGGPGAVAFSPDARRVAWIDGETGRARITAVDALPAGPPSPIRAPPEAFRPSPPPTGSGAWTSIAAGRGFACGVRGGSLACWGDPAALRLDAFPTGSGVQRVEAAGGTLCTLDGARALRCVGGNGEGQVAPGGEGVVEPGGPPVLGDVVDVAVGPWHTCAVTADGGLSCWGLGEGGRLGGASAGDRPGRVSRLSDVVDVEVAESVSCARTRAGEVWCFGRNAGGVLGLPGDQDGAVWPVEVEGIAGARWLAVGDRAACAGTAAGTKCWGDLEAPRTEERVWLRGQDACGRHAGMLRCHGGVVRSADGEVPLVPVDATELAFGDGFACGVDRAGRRACWGSNLSGELGVPVPAFRPAAAPVTGLTDAVDLAVGADHACAVRTGGEVVCWGEGWNGSLGSPDPADAPIPAPVPGVSGSAIAASDSATCVATAQGPRCWGQAAGEGGWDRPATGAAVGRRGVCALDASGAHCRLEAWEDGLPSGEVKLAGARFVSPTAALCVADGAGVRCGGRDDVAGQGLVAEQVPMGPVADLGRVDELAGSDALTCAVEAGRPRCWGMGALVPLRWPDTVRAIDVAVRDRVACLVTPEGGVACLGDDPPAAGLAGWSPVPGVSGAEEVGVGRRFACARGGGRVWCWGDPSGAHLGDGTWTWTRSPVWGE